MISRRNLAAILSALIAVVGLSCSSSQGAPKPPDPASVLGQLPAADSAQYESIHDMKKWRNPYLIVRPDGVTLYDFTNSAEIQLKTDELLPALAQLPAANWPYGRVVAAAENGTPPSEQDAVAIRRNKGIVGGLLEGAHIAVKWVPGS